MQLGFVATLLRAFDVWSRLLLLLSFALLGSLRMVILDLYV